MQRIVLLLIIVWLSVSNWTQYSQILLTGTSTPTPTTPLQLNQILNVPAQKSDNAIIPVRWVAWNPASSDLAVLYENGHAIYILDGTTGTKIQTLDFPDATYNSAFAWSPDGKYIASLLPSDIIKIWSLAENSNLSPLVIKRLGHDSHPIFFSPDGLKLAEPAYVDSPSDSGATTLFIWNTKDGQLISHHEHMTIGSWSPDGKKMVVLVGEGHNTSLQIVDPDNFHVLFVFPAISQDDTFGSYAIWSRDSQQAIVTTCNSSTCTLWTWNANTGAVNKHFDQTGVLLTGDPLRDPIALNASGTLLAATFSNLVYLWDVQSGKLLNSLTTNDGITSLSWDHSQDILVLGSKDGTIQEWEVQGASESPTEPSK